MRKELSRSAKVNRRLRRTAPKRVNGATMPRPNPLFLLIIHSFAKRSETLIFIMMSDLKITVNPDPAHALTFDVIVRDRRGESRHRVTIQADEAERWSQLGAEPSHCVAAAMRFLIDREPKEAILSAFDMRVIRRYFPEFDKAFPDYLSRLDGQPRSGA